MVQGESVLMLTTFHLPRHLRTIQRHGVDQQRRAQLRKEGRMHPGKRLRDCRTRHAQKKAAGAPAAQAPEEEGQIARSDCLQLQAYVPGCLYGAPGPASTRAE